METSQRCAAFAKEWILTREYELQWQNVGFEVLSDFLLLLEKRTHEITFNIEEEVIDAIFSIL